MTNAEITPEIPVRLDFDKHAPGFSRALSHLDHAATKALDKVEFDRRLRENARAVGETEQRIYALPAWAETPYFTERERAALALPSRSRCSRSGSSTSWTHASPPGSCRSTCGESGVTFSR